jgi:hypothetical protein
VWAHSGRQLYYESLDNHIMVVNYTVKTDSFATSKPRLWSDFQIHATGFTRNLDLAPDDQRFVIFPLPQSDTEENRSVHVTFLLNLFDELRRVPAGKR